MEDTQLSFETLARETMEMSQNFSEYEYSFEERPRIIQKIVPPATCGLLYRIEKGISTFCVRGIVSENIAEDFEEMLEGDSQIAESLKLNEEEDVSQVKFFVTESRELAESILDELINRRFPLEEDILCNVSDPGFSWWLDVSDHYFQIFFKSHGIHRAENYIRLGPLGDSSIAASRLLKAESLFRSSFPVGDFTVSDKIFSISTTDKNNINFLQLKSFFTTGENETQLESFPPTIEGKTLFYYFKEIAVIRRFWLTLEKEMAD